MPLIRRALSLAIAATGAAVIAYRCHAAGLRDGQALGERIGRVEGRADGYREGRQDGYAQATLDLDKDTRHVYLRGLLAGMTGGPLELPLAG